MSITDPILGVVSIKKKEEFLLYAKKHFNLNEQELAKDEALSKIASSFLYGEREQPALRNKVEVQVQQYFKEAYQKIKPTHKSTVDEIIWEGVHTSQGLLFKVSILATTGMKKKVFIRDKELSLKFVSYVYKQLD